MSVPELDDWEMNKFSFCDLPMDRKIYFLSLLAHEITVHARGTYPEQVKENEAIEKLMAFNEIQHLVTSQLRHMLAKDEKRYSDEDFVDILFKKAQRGGCGRDLEMAFRFAFKYLPSAK